MIAILILIFEQGTFVLIDHHFPPIANMDSPEGMDDTIKKAKPVSITSKLYSILQNS